MDGDPVTHSPLIGVEEATYSLTQPVDPPCFLKFPFKTVKQSQKMYQGLLKMIKKPLLINLRTLIDWIKSH